MLSHCKCNYFWKTDHLRTRTEIYLLPVHDRHTHALSRNTKYYTIDCLACFCRQLFTNGVKPLGCNSWFWGALIGLHGVQNCSSQQSGPSLWMVSVCQILKVQHYYLSPNGCFNPAFSSPLHPLLPTHPQSVILQELNKTISKKAALKFL